MSAEVDVLPLGTSAPPPGGPFISCSHGTPTLRMMEIATTYEPMTEETLDPAYWVARVPGVTWTMYAHRDGITGDKVEIAHRTIEGRTTFAPLPPAPAPPAPLWVQVRTRKGLLSLHLLGVDGDGTPIYTRLDR